MSLIFNYRYTSGVGYFSETKCFHNVRVGRVEKKREKRKNKRCLVVDKKEIGKEKEEVRKSRKNE